MSILTDFKAYFNPNDHMFWVMTNGEWSPRSRQMFLDMLQGDPLMRECKQVYPTKASAVKAMCQVMRESKIDGVCRLSG